jgi:hypothetical protein
VILRQEIDTGNRCLFSATLAKSVTEGLENNGFGRMFLAGTEMYFCFTISPAVVATEPYIHIPLAVTPRLK